MGITARDCNLQDILSNRRHFRVPNFQRKFEWSTEQVQELLDDLLASSSLRATGSAEAYHFVGSFIFQKQSRKESIIDGQQRLTAISIIAAVARDMARDPDLKHELDAYITDSARLRGAEPMKRIEHHRGDEEIYNQYVTGLGSTLAPPATFAAGASPSPLEQCIAYVRQRLGCLSTDSEIQKFMAHVMEDCRVIEIKLDDNDDPFRIFSTINGRGQPVRQQDIIRVTLIEAATSDAQKQRSLFKKWDNAEKLLGPAPFERYLVLRRAVSTGRSDKDRNILRNFAEDFSGPEAISSFLSSDLENECATYLDIESRHVRWRHNRRAFPLDRVLYSLSLVSFEDWKPLATNILTRFNSDPINALSWLRQLESQAWYWHLDSGGKYDDKDRRAHFHSVVKYMNNHDAWILDDSNLILRNGKKQEMHRFLKGRLEEDLPELRSLLLRLEQALRAGEPPTNIHGGFDIEHVLPKSGGGQDWASTLKIESLAERQALARQLGNLCFVERATNKDMGEREFQQKMAIAKENRACSKSRLARELCTRKSWNREDIEERTSRFSKLLIRALNF